MILTNECASCILVSVVLNSITVYPDDGQLILLMVTVFDGDVGDFNLFSVPNSNTTGFCVSSGKVPSHIVLD